MALSKREIRYSVGGKYSVYCLTEPEEHLSSCLNASLSETMQTQPTKCFSNYCSLIKFRAVKPCTLLFLCWCLNLWMLGLNCLPMYPSHPITKMSGSECRPWARTATGHKRQLRWMDGDRAGRDISSPALKHQQSPTECRPAHTHMFAY